MERKLRYRIASFATSAEGEASWGIGGRIGYWPCVRGPFIQLGLGTRRISVWYGTEYVEPGQTTHAALDHKHATTTKPPLTIDVGDRTITANAYPPKDPRLGDLWWNDVGTGWYEWSGAWREFDIEALRVS